MFAVVSSYAINSMNGEKFGRTSYWECRLTNSEQQCMVGHGFDAVVMCALCAEGLLALARMLLFS